MAALFDAGADPGELAGELGRRLAAHAGAVVLGKAEAIRVVVAALVSGGHVLLEDQPGLGKTALAKALAQGIGGRLGRVQGTPDLTPADLSGFSMYRPGVDEWEFRPGPLFSDVLLFDELNRATPRTQSALLEAMAEGQVSVDGLARPLPAPFFVLATQNPETDAGAFPLVPGQRDRFAVAVSLGLPDRAAERALLEGAGGDRALRGLAAVTAPHELAGAAASLELLHVAPSVLDYVLDVVDAARRRVGSAVSPRGALALLKVARALAAIAGRGYVTPDDVKAAAPSVLAHRVCARGEGPARLEDGAALVEEVLAATPTPTSRRR